METEIKRICLELALRTQIVNHDDNQMMHNLDGPDKILEAAKKYYEWIRGMVSLEPSKEL